MISIRRKYYQINGLDNALEFSKYVVNPSIPQSSPQIAQKKILTNFDGEMPDLDWAYSAKNWTDSTISTFADLSRPEEMEAVDEKIWKTGIQMEEDLPRICPAEGSNGVEALSN